MKYANRIDEIITPVATNYPHILNQLEAKMEDVVLLEIEKNDQIYNYHFKCFKKIEKNSFNYLFYKYSPQKGYEFLEDNVQYGYLIKLLYIEIQTFLKISEVMEEINER
ncbi:hypothetical protein INR76_06390 [Marixanthomonas sp. SCSIO 43207]|uniref:hypothetical protein n=1 Tax=Marixanthomonas sp. SCSIO 43207 TaxID=2779360 RepID=UPI001CA9262A|nr:hypothetical protein [Marixanthomonas sp. SCSIO 43207]UAB82384.1 hypothetical protein INR76_06390 [Marixanthomonas sp. SCSIO 43207]